MGEKALVGSPSTENGEFLKMDESVRPHGIDATEAHLHSAGGWDRYESRRVIRMEAVQG